MGEGIAVTRETCDLILASLSFTRQKFDDYSYPTEEMRRQRLADVDTAIKAIRFLRQGTRERSSST